MKKSVSKTTRKSSAKREKIGKTPLDPSRPIGYANPPVETQFPPGNKAAKAATGPRTHRQLRELIQEMGDEPTAGELTRLKLLLRGMYSSKSPADKDNILKHGWGVPAQPVAEMTWEDYLREQGYTEEQISDVKRELLAIVATGSQGDAAPSPESNAGGRGDGAPSASPADAGRG